MGRCGRVSLPHPGADGRRDELLRSARAPRRRQSRVSFDVVVTSERAGFYKPDPRPYRLALGELGVAPERALFVAGSAFDLVGTAAVGMRTLWHNRAGLARPPEAPPPAAERKTLKELVPFLEMN